ncbi:MAG: ATP-binding protein [Bdellovibrionota bacterium]
MANISHEVRTPINGVLGMAQVLLQLPLEPDQRQYVEMIRSASVSLLSVVNDVLDFSKIDSGKLELEQIPFQLGQLVYEALQSVALRAHEKGLELVCKPSCNIPQSLVGDPIRLRQILLNLLGNAIKFTEKGEVTLLVECEQLSEYGVRLHFLVRDTGIGIPEEKLGTIFEAFAQADGSTSRRFGGTGLGLTISREIVELMGGTIWAARGPGCGTEMHFTGLFGCDGEPETLPYDLLGRKVVVIDDNRCFLESLAESVAMRGGVFESFLQLPSADRFSSVRGGECIIVDAELIASADTARWKDIAAQAAGRFFFTVPMGRSDLLKEIRRSWDAGVMLKPILPAQVIDALLHAQADSGALPGADKRPLPQLIAERQLTILVADDVGVNQQILRLMLEPQGHSVLFANNGKEVLDFLDERGYCTKSSKPPVDLILMDAQMPVLDGSEAARLIREREAAYSRTAGGKVHLPIVAVTADALTGEREALAESGMDEYLAKPIFAQDLLRKLDQLFSDKESESPACRSLETGGQGEELVLNLPALQSRLGGNVKIVYEMLEAYLEESTVLYGALEAALAGKDVDGVLAAAHALRGSLANIDAQRACAITEAMKIAGEECAAARIVSLNDELRAALVALESEIRKVLTPATAHAPGEVPARS